MIKTKNDDCLAAMQDIPDKSIDMILCDLPYGITHNKWDIKIPFDALWGQYNRIIKDNGAIVLFGQGLFSAELIMSNKNMYRYTIIWEKNIPVGFLNARRRPLQAHEDILVFYKKLPLYNPQMVEGCKPYRVKQYSGDGKGNYGKFERNGIKQNNGVQFPRSVIKFCNRPYKLIHPTQKPVELCEYLVKTYTNVGDTVLDNCMGSGSTGIACINAGRDFIGIELSKEYYEAAKERIMNALKEKEGYNGNIATESN